MLKRFLTATRRVMGIREPVELTLSMSALDVSVDAVAGNQIPGDYLEFGVYRGSSFIRAYKRLTTADKPFGTQRRFFAFDTFSGLPASSSANRSEQYHEGAYSASEEQFLTACRQAKLDMNRVHTVKGLFSEFNREEKDRPRIESAALIYLDADLYESTVDALNVCRPFLRNGTVIVLDDYYRYDGKQGVRKAWEKFVATIPFEVTMMHQFRRVAFVLNEL